MMEDLSDLSTKLTVERGMLTFFRLAGPTTVPGETFATGFVRLADHALVEYELARTQWKKAERTRHLSARLRAQAHVETCLWTMHRALHFLDRLRACGFRYGDRTPLVPRSNSLEILSADARNRIHQLRDDVEHVEEDVVSGKADSRGPATLILRHSGISLGSTEVTFAELARWLRQTYQLAEKLNTCGPVVSDLDQRLTGRGDA